MNSNRATSILSICAVAFISCHSAYFEKSYGFSSQNWGYDDAKSFSFEIDDSTQVFDMILKLEHTDEFPYQNLYLKTATQFPSDTLVEQLLSLEISDEAGNWFGTCSGANCSISIPIQTNVHFSESGIYNLSLEQYTRTDSLNGIKRISLSLIEKKQ